MVRVTAAVLAGGASRRMGVDKRMLRLFPESPTFLQRTIAIGRSVADRVVVVGAPDLREMGGAVGALPDGWPGEGPLGGLLTAIDAFPNDVLIVLACDYPLLQARLVSRIVERLDRHGAAIAVVEPGVPSTRHPLVAAYDAARIGPTARTLFAGGERRMSAMVDRISVHEVGSEAGVDPAIHRLSLTNVNAPERLEELRGRALDMDARRRWGGSALRRL